jgi:hypothetical protein
MTYLETEKLLEDLCARRPAMPSSYSLVRMIERAVEGRVGDAGGLVPTQRHV